ncbi:NYN domain-containing protein [Streptomyces sp. NPDC048171]|uniref:NYN domain-containing protein n=1 Tax=Streptomyces sp. NPDC048171 TaxID=3365504 RepID=UPI003715C641
MTSENDGITRLGALLGALDPQGLPPGPREVAELLWLAANLPSGAVVRPDSAPTGAAVSGAELLVPDGREDVGGTSDASTSEGDGEQAGRLYLTDTAASGEELGRMHTASPVRVTGAPALTRRRALARSLRPLKRRVPSNTRWVVDEDATAERIADEGQWMPVLVPAQDRWLDLALVIDVHGDGGALWQSMARELLSVLRELGAFRDMRTYWLRRRPDGSPGLATSPRGRLRSPATASDPTGRTVALVLTDGVDQGWGTEALRSALRQWARRGPTAILQALPDYLWGQTALSPEPGRFRSTGASGSLMRLHFTPYTLGADVLQPGEIPVPVLALDPEWLASWAWAVAGVSEFDGVAVRLSASGAGTAHGLGPAVEGRAITFEEFLAQAQPGLFRLAAYLSAAPLNLAVMRLVQSAMLPGSPPSDLAEIVFSGILRRLPADGGERGPLQQAYEFVPGLREKLLSTLRRDEADQVISSVSAYVERSVPTGVSRFTAAMVDPGGPLLLPAGARHWAEVQHLVRRRHSRRTSAAAEAGEAVPAGRVSEWLGMVESPASEESGAQLTSAPADDPLVRPGHSSGRRFLIIIGVSRYRSRSMGALPGVVKDVARVRTEFEALGYTAVLPELASSPTSAVALSSIKAWARSKDGRAADSVVVYFAGHAAALKGEVRLLTVESGGASDSGGLTVREMQRSFSGGPARLLLILDTCFPSGVSHTFTAKDPAVWLLSCHTVHEDSTGSNFTRALTAEMASLRDNSSIEPPFQEFGLRVIERMLHDREPSADPGMVLWVPADPSLSSHFFTFPSDRPESVSHPLFPDMIVSSGQSMALDDLTDWILGTSTDHRPRVVLGDRGSGKTTLLHLLEHQLMMLRNRKVDSSQSERKGGIRPVLLFSKIAGTANDVWRLLARRLDLPGSSPTEWVAHLASFPKTVALLLDRLPEASPLNRQGIVDSVVRPLSTMPNVRLVIAEDRKTHIHDLGVDVKILHLQDELIREEWLTLTASPAEDPNILDQLFALPRVHLIVDGSHITEWDTRLPPELQKSTLLRRLSRYVAPTGAEITCVFDEPDLAMQVSTAPRDIRVLFSASSVLPVKLIRNLVESERRPDRTIVVVSTDLNVIRSAVGAGADPVYPSALLAWLSREDRTQTGQQTERRFD